MARLIERFTAAMRGDAPAAPVGTLIGLRPTSIEHGKAAVELEAGAQHPNPMGTPHGGILCDVADAATGTAYATTLGDEETFAMLELKINFFRPFWSGMPVATGRMLKSGR